MGRRAVFLDRDRTIIEDPGYLTDPSAVKLLPAVETALRGLAEAGFVLVVVTNQSAVARGLLTVEGLKAIHDEMDRQLSARGVKLDGIYYCPYHPDGTVEAYARESEDRKPRPGMLLRAAKELDIDLAGSWMVGDSPRDVEAGQRAGCRTIRVRVHHEDGPEGDEDAQADFTVRNLLEASHVVLRESGLAAQPARAEERADSPPARSAGAHEGAASTGESAPPGADLPTRKTGDTQILQEILRHIRQMNATRHGEFSLVRLAAMIVQFVALAALVGGLMQIPDMIPSYETQLKMHAFLLSAIVLQLVALTLFIVSRQR